MTLTEKERIERAAIAAMQALIESRSGSAPADIAQKSVEFATALIESVDAKFKPE
jgi:hypothetical protein